MTAGSEILYVLQLTVFPELNLGTLDLKLEDTSGGLRMLTESYWPGPGPFTIRNCGALSDLFTRDLNTPVLLCNNENTDARPGVQ